MISLWAGGATCAVCIMMGWWCRRRYRKRQDVWSDLVQLLVFASEQIEYEMASLPTICIRFAAAHPTSLVAEACGAYPDIKPVVCLPAAQWAHVTEMLLSLGRSDTAGQAARLAYVRAEIERMRQAAMDDAHSKGDLYAKLWAVLGVGLMIWMV